MYKRLRNFLATNKNLSFILSHGFLHLCVLFILIMIIAGLLSLYFTHQPSYRVISSDVSLVDKPFVPLKTLNLYIKPNEKGYYTFEMYPKYGYDTIPIEEESKMFQLKKSIYAPESKVKWIWKNSEKTKVDKISNYKNVNIEPTDSGFIAHVPNYETFFALTKSTDGTFLSEKNNPYYLFYLKLNFGNNYDLIENSRIVLDFGIRDDEIITFNHVYPEPTRYGLNKIIYEGKKDVESVLNSGGIYIYAQNAKKAKVFDNLFLIISVLGGTIIAFALDIIITLIYKWRRLKVN